MMVALAETHNVTMRFGSFTAVDSVNLKVGGGEVVGLLGANGAGKTTVIRLLLGLVRPSQGEVSLFGALPSIATRRRIGYVPQTLGLYDDLTVQENWAFNASAFDSTRFALPPSISDARDRLFGTVPNTVPASWSRPTTWRRPSSAIDSS
jgi:ABC-2 type transport system ATP-binding protein/ribosome-dependent ATPase